MIIGAVATIGLFPIPSIAAATSEKTYTLSFSILDSMGKQQAGLFNNFLKTLATVFNTGRKDKIAIQSILNKQTYLKGASQGTFDIVAAKEAMPGRAGFGKYKAFLTVPLYGEKNPQRCLYVNANSPIKAVKDMKGKRIMISQSKLSYLALRKLLGGQDPNYYFLTHHRAKDNISGIYAAAMDQMDVVALKSSAVKFLASSNPGPVKKIRSVACFYDDVWWGMSYNPKRVNAQFIKDLQKFAQNLPKNPNPQIRRYMPFLRQVGLTIIPISHEEALALYKPFIDLEKEAKARKWDKDYQTWVSLMKNAKK